MNISITKQPSEVLKQIASQAKNLRKQHGLTQRELARISDVSLGSLSRFEQTGDINLISLLKIAQILEALEEFEKLFPQKIIPSKKVAKLFEE